VRHLLDVGYRVRVLDRLFFGPASLAALDGDARFDLVVGDVRDIGPEVFTDAACVVDLAALSNDPAGELDPEATMAINFRGRNRIAAMARDAGVRRYVLASSCSVYGFQDDLLDETSATNPLTTYAQANLKAERGALPLATPEFSVTALRLATLFGLSHRMRFDLAVNGIALGLQTAGKARVLRDGTQWRPFLHVADAAKAFSTVLDSRPEAVSGRVFNVGSNDLNVQLLPLAQRIAVATGVPWQMEWYGDPDNRSYRVSFDRISSELGFSTRVGIEAGAAEIFAALKSGAVLPTDECFTVRWYKQLIAKGLALRQ